MERNLLVGNGINIQFGGANEYSGYATMNRVVENINISYERFVCWSAGICCQLTAECW